MGTKLPAIKPIKQPKKNSFEARLELTTATRATMTPRHYAGQLISFILFFVLPVRVAADVGDVLASLIGSTILLLAACAGIGYWARENYDVSDGERARRYCPVRAHTRLIPWLQ